MRTTLDLPDELMRRVKIRAINEHKKLRDAIAEYLDRGVSMNQESSVHRKKLPPLILLEGGYMPSQTEIAAAIQDGRA